MRVKCGSTQSRTGQDKCKYRYRYRRVTTVLTVQSFTWFTSTSSRVESSRIVVQASPGLVGFGVRRAASRSCSGGVVYWLMMADDG